MAQPPPQWPVPLEANGKSATPNTTWAASRLLASLVTCIARMSEQDPMSVALPNNGLEGKKMAARRLMLWDRKWETCILAQELCMAILQARSKRLCRLGCNRPTVSRWQACHLRQHRASSSTRMYLLGQPMAAALAPLPVSLLQNNSNCQQLPWCFSNRCLNQQASWDMRMPSVVCDKLPISRGQGSPHAEGCLGAFLCHKSRDGIERGQCCSSRHDITSQHLAPEK